MQAKKIGIFVGCLIMVGLLVSYSVGAKEAKKKIAVISSKTAPEPARREQAEKEIKWFTQFCSEKNWGVEQVDLKEISQDKIKLGQYQLVVIFLFTEYPEAFWEKVGQYVKNGGRVLWSGNHGIFKDLDKKSWPQFEKIFGVRINGYQSDPMLGEGPTESLMWVKIDKHMAREFKKEKYAFFGGESIAVEAVKPGKAAGIWLNRDQKTTEGGPALVLTKNAKGGKTVFLGFYLLRPVSEGSFAGKELKLLLSEAINWLLK